MKVVLRPLNTNSWAGVTHYRNCYEDLTPYYLQSGRKYTGFESDDETEQAELDKERKKLEKALKTELDQNSPYWEHFFIRVREEDIILDDSDPLDKLKSIFLAKHAFVKTSLNQHKAGARFLLVNEEEEARKQNVNVRNKKRAYDELSTMSAIDVRDALRLYGVNSDDLGEQISFAKLSEFIEKSPIKFIALWVDNKGRKTQTMIEKAIGKGIMRRTNLMYLYGTTNMGKSIEEAIAFIEDEKNQDVKTAISKQVLNDKN